MSFTKNVHKLSDKTRLEGKITETVDEIEDQILCNPTESSTTYAVTVSKKNSPLSDEDNKLCSGQKSFISIHSTDLCQITEVKTPTNLEECNVEVLSLNEVFPSTSEESLSNDDESPAQKKKGNKNKSQGENTKTSYVPSNSKSSTGSARPREAVEAQTTGYSDFDIPKNTLYVMGSNPGEPKMTYTDPPKKISKSMKKLMRNAEKHKTDGGNSEKSLNKLTRGILKDGRCAPECTGDSSMQGVDNYLTNDDMTLPFPMEVNCHASYNKQNADKNVKFNTQVVIIHFTGDICLGQSVETLSKEKDQQARNSELRKTFLTKYNELWSTQK